MANPVDSLPADVVEAWKSGNKVEAIKRLREATSMGLAEAKAVVDALDGAGNVSVRSVKIGSGEAVPEMLKALQDAGALPPEVLEALQRGEKLEALKRLAAAAKEGRVKANVKVQVTVNRHGEKSTTIVSPSSSSPSAPSASSPSAISTGNLSGADGLAPGEVPRSKNGLTAALVLIAIVVIALVVYARYA